jgi:hypothetical protein
MWASLFGKGDGGIDALLDISRDSVASNSIDDAVDVGMLLQEACQICGITDERDDCSLM